MNSASIRNGLLAVALLAPALAGQGNQVSDLPPAVQAIRMLYIELKDEEALAACNDFLVSNNADPVVLEFRARCLRQLGRFEDAAKTLEGYPNKSARMRLLLAECLAMVPSRTSEANAIVDEVASDDPNAIEPRMARARVFLAQGRLKEAASELNYVRITRPKLYECQLLLAQLAERVGAFDEAMKLYTPLLTRQTEFERTDTHHERDVAMGLAGCYVRLQNYAGAIELYQQIGERFPKSPAVYAQIATCHQMQNHFAEAIAALEKAVELGPQIPELRLRLAGLLASQSRPDDAILHYEKLLDQGGPVQLVAEIKLAGLWLEKGVIEKARQHVDVALKADPENPEVCEIAGRLREKLNDPDGAKQAYRKVLAKNPIALDSIYRLGLLLARSADEDEKAEAKRLLDRHKRIDQYRREIERTNDELALNPRSPLLLTRMAGLLNLAGEYELARVWGSNSDKLNSRSASTCIQMGYITANLGDNAAALGYFERAVKLLPKGAVPKIDEYIEKIRKNEPLPLPLGEAFRPGQQPKEPGAASGDGAPAAAPAKEGPTGG